MKYKVQIVFGIYAVEAYNDTDGTDASAWKKAQRIANNGDGRCITKTFDTFEERKAYLDGLEDAEGWQAIQVHKVYEN